MTGYFFSTLVENCEKGENADYQIFSLSNNVFTGLRSLKAVKAQDSLHGRSTYKYNFSKRQLI